jgi:hypothetical protein
VAPAERVATGLREVGRREGSGEAPKRIRKGRVKGEEGKEREKKIRGKIEK